MQIALLTDSAAGLEPQLLKKYQVKVIPVPLEINGVRYYEDRDLNLEQYRDMLADKLVGSIAQVRVAELVKNLEQLVAQGYDTVLGICPAGGLSTLATHLQACSGQIAGLTIHAFDTQTIGRLQGQFVEASAEMIARGDDIQTVLRKLGRMRRQLQTFIALTDLKSLQKQGYVSNGKSFFSKKILPLQTLGEINEQGQFEVFNTKHRAKNAYAELQSWIYTNYDALEDRMQITIVGDYDNEAFRDHWVPNLRQDFPKAKLEFAQMGVATALTFGLNSILVSWGPRWQEFLIE
ncbi:DegV family protein [Ligilactobacillus agilis]|uniref:DegV family protein n=1 Tax=Ligilactobacillus agilis TaxID=1601 RepID=UPI001437DD86|nr:DegV family protein [Ligilactobacillus agilis]GET13838.1 DegV family protein [Ligilactobacillus agilis]